jgi:hypothetical protein
LIKDFGVPGDGSCGHRKNIKAGGMM